MANRLKTWTAEILTDEDLNAEFDNIYQGTIDRPAGRLGHNDDIPETFGSTQDAQLEWNTDQTQDALYMGLSGSNTFILGEKADMGTNIGLAGRTNPTLILKSADHTATTEYLELSHALINSGTGAIALQVAGSTVGSIDSTGILVEGNLGVATSSPSGGDTFIHIQQNDTATLPAIEVDQASTGDAAIQVSIAGDAYALGIDNSDADQFQICYSGTSGSAVMGTNCRFSITSGGLVGVGLTTAITDFHVQESTTDTVPTVEIEQLSTGDAGLQFSIAGDAYAMGIDNSDSDIFKISYASAAGTAALGTGDRLAINASGDFMLSGGTSNGAWMNVKVATTEVTGMSGATATASSLIPAGSLVLGVSARVTTTISGPTDWDLGTATTVNQWGDALALPSGTTVDGTDFVDESNPVHYRAAEDVVLTANGGTFSAGAVRLNVHYISFTAPTS